MIAIANELEGSVKIVECGHGWADFLEIVGDQSTGL
jgi:hypothetical protein